MLHQILWIKRREQNVINCLAHCRKLYQFVFNFFSFENEFNNYFGELNKALTEPKAEEWILKEKYYVAINEDFQPCEESNYKDLIQVCLAITDEICI